MRKLPSGLGFGALLLLLSILPATCSLAASNPPKADITAAIAASATQAARGDHVTFTLTAANPAGPQSAASVQLTASFPSQLQLNSTTCIAGATVVTPSNPVVWNIGTLTAGTSMSCSVVTTVIDDSMSSVVVHASVSSTTGDPVPANNTANYTLRISPANADLVAAIGANASTLTVGQVVNVTLKASNLGPADATSTRLIGNFPAQLKLNSVPCVNGTPSNPVVWNIGTLAAGTNKTCVVQATLTATSATLITVSDSLTSAAPDVNTGNNSASVTMSILQQQAAANLSIHLAGAAAGQTYSQGDILRIRVTAANTSSDTDSSGVVATVHVPNDGSLGGISTTCGTVDASGRLVWSIGTLSRNSSQACTVTATVSTATSAIPVSASITAAALGSDLSKLMDALVFPVDSSPRQISTSISGAPTTKPSTKVELTHDGKTAVFQSQETDLVTNNTNTNGQDIYRVGSDGKPVLETLDSAGHQLIGTSSLPAISGDGGIVAFAFAAGAAKQAKDAITSSMWGGSAGQPKQQMDNGMGGAAPNGSVSGGPSVTSANGSKKLVFCSAASNLVPNDTNGARDIFLVDPSAPTQSIQRVSTDSNGQQLAGDSCEPSLSADGTKLVFTLSAPSLYGNSNRQVVRKDLTTGALELISLTTVPAGPGANADSSEPTVDANGSVVAFTSKASDLDGLGAPAGGAEAFVSLAQSGADGAARILKRVRSGDGTVPNGSSQHPQLSADGNTVVMQTSATNFFGSAKQMNSATPACGAVALTTNFFSPAALGSSLCSGQTSNQNPTISGDGTTTGFDSNAAQPGTSSNNSNAYTQGVGASATGVANLSGDLSGQWFDANQSGQGLVIDVSSPDASNNRTMILTWFVYVNGQPTWVQGVGTPQAGTGTQAGLIVVQMQTGIFKGSSFPRGDANVTSQVWGDITLTFVDANTGTMSWTSSVPGFNAGTMPITHFLPVSLPAQDPVGARIKACYSGNWFNHAQSGDGFEFEVLSSPSPLLVVDWFAYGPDGSPVWLQGVGAISGNTAQMQLQLINGTGAQFPPKYDPTQITQNVWGTANFTFTNSTNASVTWNSSLTGYGTGTMSLQPLAEGLLDRRGCQ